MQEKKWGREEKGEGRSRDERGERGGEGEGVEGTEKRERKTRRQREADERRAELAAELSKQFRSRSSYNH